MSVWKGAVRESFLEEVLLQLNLKSLGGSTTDEGGHQNSHKQR